MNHTRPHALEESMREYKVSQTSRTRLVLNLRSRYSTALLLHLAVIQPAARIRRKLWKCEREKGSWGIFGPCVAYWTNLIIHT